jgi:CHRD domain-containing protein
MQMKTLHIALAGLIALSVPTMARAAAADDGKDRDRDQTLRATLIGYEEVPSVSTPARGSFIATVADNDASIDYTLRFNGLVGTVQQSHIHFAQKGVNGSIVIWLCQTTTTPAPAAVANTTPPCVQNEDIKGHITAASVLAANTASQLIAAGELAEVLAAIRAGVAYVNVHATPSNPGGEIRGQVRASDDKHDKH